MPLPTVDSFPTINDLYGEYWRGAIEPHMAAEYATRNRPALRVICIVTNSALAIQYPNNTGKAAATIDNLASINKALKSNILRKGNALHIDISDYITDISWTCADDTDYLEATISVDNTFELFSMIPLGARFILQRRKPVYAANGKWYPMVECYMWTRQKSVEGQTSKISFTCYERMYWLANNSAKKKVYKKDKAHKHGWAVKQIIKDICRNAGIPVGVIDIGANTRIDRFETKGTVLQEIQNLLAKEKKKSGRKAKPIIHTRDGKLNIIIPLDPQAQVKKSKQIPLFNDAYGLEGASIRQNMDKEGTGEEFATRLILKQGKADTKKNKKKRRHKVIKQKEIVILSSDPNIEKVFGIVEKTDTSLRDKDIDLGRLKALGRDQLARRQRPKVEIEFTTRGYPNLWPGDFVLIDSKKIGTSLRGFYRIKSIGYEISGGQMLMTIIVNNDNYVAFRAARNFTLPKITSRIRY